MKSLSEYIFKSTTQDNIPIGLLDDHFYLEFAFSSYKFQDIGSYINEKYGTYDGEVDFVLILSEYIVKDLQESDSFSYKLNKEDLEEVGFKNIFFKEIIIKIGNSYITGFNDNNIKYDKTGKLFETVIININSKDYNDFDSLTKVLTHELTHAWEEYGRYINNSELKLSELTNNSSKYKDYIASDSITNGEKICKTVLYFLTNFEINAYMSELSTILRKENLKIKDYNDALEHFKNSDVWTNYSRVLVTLENLKEEYKEDFKNYYNKINNVSLTYNKIQKKLLDTCKKVFNKMSTLIPKIYYDWYSENKVSESFFMPRMTLYDRILLNPSNKLDNILNKEI